MAKKLKKKIEELCGLTNLDLEERRAKAEKILDDNEWKQELCNELLGLSFKDLDRTLRSILAERQVKNDEHETKLDIYRSGRNDRSKNVEKHNLNQRTHKTNRTNDSKPRSLKEILDQVYAPRATENTFSKEERVQLVSLQGFSRRDEVHEDSMYDGCEPEE